MDGKGRRRKGHDFERKMANFFKKYFPNAKRGYQSRNNIDLVPDVDIPIFYVECKRGKKTNIKAALQQAEDKRRDDDKRLSLAVVKDDNAPEIVAMHLSDFEVLLDAIFLDMAIDVNDRT